MSATLKVVSGKANLRIGGMEFIVDAPWEEAGVEFTPPEGLPETFEQAIALGQLAPAMGAADAPPRQVGGVVEVVAVGSPVYLHLWKDPESAHPDQTYAQGGEPSQLILEPGESWSGNVAHSNAWTVVVVAA